MNSIPATLTRRVRDVISCGLFAALLFGAASVADSVTDEALSIDADFASLNLKDKVRVFEGDVVVERGSLVVEADRVTVNMEADGKDGNIITANGKPVSLRDKAKEGGGWIDGYADKLVLRTKSDEVSLLGNVLIKNASTTVQSGSVVYYADTGNFMAGSARGDGQTAASTGRTTITITDEL